MNKRIELFLILLVTLGGISPCSYAMKPSSFVKKLFVRRSEWKPNFTGIDIHELAEDTKNKFRRFYAIPEDERPNFYTVKESGTMVDYMGLRMSRYPFWNVTCVRAPEGMVIGFASSTENVSTLIETLEGWLVDFSDRLKMRDPSMTTDKSKNGYKRFEALYDRLLLLMTNNDDLPLDEDIRDFINAFQFAQAVEQQLVKIGSDIREYMVLIIEDHREGYNGISSYYVESVKKSDMFSPRH